MYLKSGEIFFQKCESRILICIKSGIVKSVGTDCENEFSIFNYYDGKNIDLKIKGKSSLFDNCGGSGESPTMCMRNEEFSMQFASDSTKLKYKEVNYSITKLKYCFKTKGLIIYESPSFSSKIKVETKNNCIAIELVEIGSLEKKDEEWNVWYKVKLNTIEGWCFGNLDF